MGERALIRQFRAQPPSHPWMKVGPGHDCAVLRWDAARDLAFKIDQIVEGVHFVLEGPEAATPRRVGWKALAKACSDIAATGFWPVAATVGAHLRQGQDDAFAREVHAGIVACCERFGIALAGGDFTSGPAKGGACFFCVSLIGEGPADGAWTRGGARPGDTVLVTGALGGSRAARHLDFLPRLDEARRIRARAGDAVHAAMDITDGLSRDIGHICEMSRCGMEIEAAAVPLAEAARAMAAQDGRSALDHALGDGEDFELLLAVDPVGAARLLDAWPRGEGVTPLTAIGTVRPESEGRRLKMEDGSNVPLPDWGYEHATDGETSDGADA